MKLKALATLAIASLALSFSVAPATADDIATPVSVVTETIAASPDATLTFESPLVETVPAPIPVADPVAVPEEVPVTVPVDVTPVAPVQVVEAPVNPVVTAPAPTAPEVTPPAVVVAPVPTAPAVTVPTVIVENPVCVGQNLFTVTAEGDCANAPLGYTVADLRVDALHELNSRNPNPTQEVIDAFNKTYLGATSRPLAHQHIVYSVAIPGVVYNFDSNY